MQNCDYFNVFVGDKRLIFVNNIMQNLKRKLSHVSRRKIVIVCSLVVVETPLKSISLLMFLEAIFVDSLYCFEIEVT